MIIDPADNLWRRGDEVPPVESGALAEFIVAVLRARTGKVYSFSATYLNGYGLTYNDGCPKGKDEFCEGCEDGCPTTGWFRETGADDEGTTFHTLILAEGDRLMGWRHIPQWPAMPLAPTFKAGSSELIGEE